MPPLQIYAIFHLNLAYSSIEEEQRPEVIRRCYAPLLELASDLGLPFGIEATGYTLREIARLEPSWLGRLRHLVAAGPCEFIGSGFVQLIGPLVPAIVNFHNLRLGHAVYECLLGRRPRLSLVNEQAYSCGLIEHYLSSGCEAIVMEWDNPARYHPEWSSELRYAPQQAMDQQGRSIPVLWNHSIAFQQLQRYAHGELEIEEFLEYIHKHVSTSPRALSIYGNDVEIFDYRPGRYTTESTLQHREWERIRTLFEALRRDTAVQLVSPSSVLQGCLSRGGSPPIQLESPEAPIAVKKQDKYNITRWAVTGRDDLGCNTSCHRILRGLLRTDLADDALEELCYLWSSDFRTHITDRRWQAYRTRLAASELRFSPSKSEQERLTTDIASALPTGVSISHQGRFLVVEMAEIRLALNCRRGLAIESLAFPLVSERPLVGTIHHGFYDDIALGADFYSGHVVLEAVGLPKVTDLDPVEPVIEHRHCEIDIRGMVKTPLGVVTKTIRIRPAVPCVEIEVQFDWSPIPQASLRVGHVTILPDAFERDTLSYRTHNGGNDLETFSLHGRRVEHGAPVSFLVSASKGIGMTEGVVEIGDAHHVLRVEVDQTASAPVGLVTYRETGSVYFCRLALSMREMDETTLRASSTERYTSMLRMRLSAKLHESIAPQIETPTG